jgi:hypothetical protein
MADVEITQIKYRKIAGGKDQYVIAVARYGVDPVEVEIPLPAYFVPGVDEAEVAQAMENLAAALLRFRDRMRTR